MNRDWWAFFAERTTENTETGCWEWIGAKAGGYGWTTLVPGRGGTTTGAHRVAYAQLVGPIPAGLHIRHMCHNRACCNPDHLRVGTPADNAKDRQNAGRTTNAGGPPKLSPTQQLEIIAARKAGITYRELEVRYGMTRQGIWKMLRAKGAEIGRTEPKIALLRRL